MHSQDFISKIESEGFYKSALNLKTIHRIISSDSTVEIYSINVKNNQSKIIAFNHQGNFLLSFASICDNEISLSTFDGQLLFYALTYNQEQFILDKSTRINEAFNSFSNEVRLSSVSQTTKKATSEGCCRRQSSYSGCVNCSLDFFNINKWYMEAGLWTFAPEVMAALYASCIGAGSDASC